MWLQNDKGIALVSRASDFLDIILGAIKLFMMKSPLLQMLVFEMFKTPIC